MNRIGRAELGVVVLVLTLVGTVSALAAGVSAPTDRVTITSGPSGNPNPVGSSGAVQLGAAATDSRGDALTYQWIAQGGAGSFDNATAQNPIWTAPANTTAGLQVYRIQVFVTCSHHQTAGSSYYQKVWPAPDSVIIVQGVLGNPNPVVGGGTVALTAAALDTLGHVVTYTWTGKDLAGVSFGDIDDIHSQNPVWTAPSNDTRIVQVYNLKVTAVCSHGKVAGAFLRVKVLPTTQTAEITAAISGTPVPVASGGTVECTVNAVDSLGHTTTYLWTATDSAGNPLGSFDDATLASPLWTAPANTSGVTQGCRMDATITCSAGKKLVVAFRENIQPVPTGSDYVEITAGPYGDPNPAASAGQVQLTLVAVDSLGHTLTYAWTAYDSVGNPAGAFDDATAQNPIWTAPGNPGTVLALYSIKVVVTCSAGKTASTSYAQKVRPEPVPLNSAWSFAILAGAAVTNTGSSIVTGDIGVSTGTSIGGFPPGICNGIIHPGNDAPTIQAKVDLGLAYTAVAGYAGVPTIIPGADPDLTGMTLYPGIYQSATSFKMSDNIWLDAQGDADAVFVIKMGTSLTTTHGNVILLGNAKAANIYWQCGTSASIGSTTNFQGNILAAASITLISGATLTNGRALCETGTVTLDGNIITRP